MAYIGNSPVQDETVTSAQIVDGAIVDADVNSSAAIAFSKMANLTASRLLVSDGSGDVSVSNVTSAEALLLDGGTSATSTTLAAADRLIVNDNGTIVQVALSDFETFIEGAIDTLSSAMTFSSTVTVGSDGSGQDVIFYSGTSGDNLTWDSSEEKLTITGTNGQTALDVADGNLVVADNIDLEGDIDVNGTANLDAVDIDGAVQIDNTVTVGVNDTGYDVKFFGATATNGYMLWDESTDDLILGSSSKLGIGTTSPIVSLQVQDGDSAIFSNSADANAKSMLFYKSRNATDGSHTIVQDNDNLGIIKWVGSDGGDWIRAAQIFAEVDGTPGDDDMPGALVFQTTPDGAIAPTEKMRITQAGLVGIGTNAPASTLVVTPSQNNNTGYSDSTVTIFGSNTSSSNYSLKAFNSGGAGLAVRNDGNVGIGTASPARDVVIHGTSNATMQLTTDDTGEAAGDGTIFQQGGTNGVNCYIYNQEAGSIIWGTSDTERMRIDSSGQVGIGGAANGAHLNIFADMDNSSSWGIRLDSTVTSGTAYMQQFRDGNENVCGSITIDTSGNGATYTSGSDYRIKTNVEEMSGSIERLEKIKPYKYNAKKNAEGRKLDGFYAHELAEIIPEAVVGEKDEVDEDGEMIIQGVDYGRITPLLVSALQEAIERIKVLENA